MIGKTISHYKILEKLGEGGMGVVYKAEDTELKREVAIKFLPHHIAASEEERQRFKVEAQAAAALNHPNITHVYAIEKHDDEMFIVMEYIKGQELKDKIEAGPLSIDDTLNLTIQIANGLQAAHEKGVIHRDIKSANIMLTEKGDVKIMDFGLAKVKGGPKLTKEQSTLGTASYMSPEQSRGEEVDHRTDIFSLGILLYEMLTGQLPFKGDYEQAITYSILNEDQESITALRTGIPMELERIVNKCLQKKADARYQHADELLVDLQQIMKATEWNQGLSGTSNLRKVLFAGVILSIVILAVVWYSFFRSQLAPERKMLVVLPFENLGPPADEYFADGITEEITSRLAGLHGLGVISRTSAMQYKNMEKTIAEIGEELGVGYVLTGTIRWDRGGSNRVRVTPQLIRVSDDTHLWTRTYEKLLEEIFAVQSDIAEEVAKQLDLNLLEPERKALLEKPTDNLQAYDFYLRGKQYAAQHQSRQEQSQAVEMYEKAINLDSTFALAYANLSDTQSLIYFFSFDETSKRLSKAKAAADKALALQPNLPDAHVALAYYYYRGRKDFDRAL